MKRFIQNNTKAAKANGIRIRAGMPTEIDRIRHGIHRSYTVTIDHSDSSCSVPGAKSAVAEKEV